MNLYISIIKINDSVMLLGVFTDLETAKDVCTFNEKVYGKFELYKHAYKKTDIIECKLDKPLLKIM